MYKSLLSFAIGLLFATFVFGQNADSNKTETSLAPKFLVGGNFSFNSTNNTTGNIILLPPATLSTDNRTSFFSVSPYIGYQLNSNWIVGINLFYSSNTATNIIESQDDIEFSTTEFQYGLFARYSFYASNRLTTFIQPSARLINSASDSNSLNSTERNTNGIGLGIGFGLTYNLSSRWRVISTIGILSYQTGTVDQVSFSFPIFPDPTEPVRMETSEDFSSIAANFSISSIRFGAEFLF